MRKTFGSAFALILVALFAVAPASPATADPGGIHLHIAGKVGQKAVGSTIIFGAEGLTGAPQGPYWTPNASVSIFRVIDFGFTHLSPNVKGWTPSKLLGMASRDSVDFQVPASGSYVGKIPLPDLPAGEYQIELNALAGKQESGAEKTLNVEFTIAADGTFTKITYCLGGNVCVQPPRWQRIYLPGLT